MRRDYFSLHTTGLDWVETDDAPEQPALIIDFEGPAAVLQERMTGGGAELLEADELDVSFRFLTGVEDTDAKGVLSLSDRVTGEFILEVNAEADRIAPFVRVARRYGKLPDAESRYRVVVRIDGEDIVEYEKRTFLLYNADGNLLRDQSLIPSGVEL